MLNPIGVTQFGAREKRLNGPTPLYPPGENQLRNSYLKMDRR